MFFAGVTIWDVQFEWTNLSSISELYSNLWSIYLIFVELRRLSRFDVKIMYSRKSMTITCSIYLHATGPNANKSDNFFPFH